jgi:hypothetical protein
MGSIQPVSWLKLKSQQSIVRGLKYYFFSWLKSQKLLFNTEIQHFGWLNQIIHFPLKPTERSKGLVLLQVFAWHPKRSEWAEVVQREAGDCTSKNRKTPMNAYGL